MTQHSATRSMFDPSLVRPAIIDSFKKLTPRTQIRNPVMFVRVCRQHTDHRVVDRSARGPSRGSGRLHFGDRTVGCGSRCCLPTLPRHWPRAAARPKPHRCAAPSADVVAKKLLEARYGAKWQEVSGSTLRRGDVILIESGDTIPADGEVIEGRGIGRRVGDYRRICTRDPRIGRRFLVGHGRHAECFRLDRGAAFRSIRAKRSLTG